MKVIGLRPGEKLYEELLLGDDPQKTYHEKIQKAQDPFIPFDQLKINLDKLSILLDENKEFEVKDMLNRLIPSYRSNSKIIDNIYKEKLKFNSFRQSSETMKDQENKIIRIKTK